MTKPLVAHRKALILHQALSNRAKYLQMRRLQEVYWTKVPHRLLRVSNQICLARLPRRPPWIPLVATIGA